MLDQPKPSADAKNTPSAHPAVADLMVKTRAVFAHALEDVPEHPEWTKIMALPHVTAFHALRLSEGKGIPPALIERTIVAFIEKELANKQFGAVARFLTNTKRGTPELIAELEQLEEQELQRERERVAANILVARIPKEVLYLSADATLADLKAELDGGALTKEAELLFWKTLEASDPDAVPNLLDEWSGPDAANIRVLDFMDCYDLPIVFGAED